MTKAASCRIVSNTTFSSALQTIYFAHQPAGQNTQYCHLHTLELCDQDAAENGVDFNGVYGTEFEGHGLGGDNYITVTRPEQHVLTCVVDIGATDDVIGHVFSGSLKLYRANIIRYNTTHCDGVRLLFLHKSNNGELVWTYLADHHETYWSFNLEWEPAADGDDFSSSSLSEAYD